ncbi:SPW repeat-containing protein [Mycolicibacterium rutilum]|uniref:SPW repeat-containing protein n=1 Tax=Mycolicibacterium rutilum TaxID=370526 RepID=A0A1H6JR96_MYCRU|nr:SPW repeat protein [Mycolicibacterium rutilum]SEH62401.1 SPW repeat-containing protein [Mycolicibacterium rutilum]
MRRFIDSWTSWAALLVGIGAVIAAFTTTSTRLGYNLTVAFAAFVVFFAALSLLARKRTNGSWGLVTIGLAMAMVPFLVANFQPDPGAAWTGAVAGLLAMVLGAIGWMTGQPPTVTGISHWGSPDAPREKLETWLNRGGLVIGLVVVLLAVILPGASPAAVLVTAGLGVFLMVASVWAWLAADATRDYFMVATVGFALFLAPTAAGYGHEAAAWAAWIPGAIATALGVTGYLRGDARDLTADLKESAVERYHRTYREAPAG